LSIPTLLTNKPISISLIYFYILSKNYSLVDSVKSQVIIHVLILLFICLIFFYTFSSFYLVRLIKQTLNPILAIYSANPSPIPSDAPVITAQLFYPYFLSRFGAGSMM
jgi:hypothetical protein